MPWTPLVLDTFQFDEAELETPEAFGDMAGTQSVEQHDFPGGIRTQKAYGYFPAVLKWKAKFFGTYASDRAEGVKRILAAGYEVKLQYDQRAWLGRLVKFSPTARHSWHYEYDAEFWPRLDYGAPGITDPPPVDQGALLDQHISALNSMMEPSPAAYFPVTGMIIAPPVFALTALVRASISAVGGVIANIDPITQAAIYTASLAALAACAPYQVLLDPTMSSPASDAAARIQAIQDIMIAPAIAIATIQTINPNLMALAAVYYGNAMMWRTIADANGMVDPQPIGSFDISIPMLG